MSNKTKSSFTRKNKFKRILLIILFIVIYSLVEIIMGLVIFMQILFVLVRSRTNETLLKIAKVLSLLIYDILKYLSFITEDKPYPF